MGSDFCKSALRGTSLCFNPRSHVGSDGACEDTLRYPTGFNPRSHVGSDAHVNNNHYLCNRFQSTLPRGERRSHRTPLKQIRSFNPRSHVGSDNLDTYKAKQIAVSIHAPTWGATCLDPSSVCAPLFQSTLPRGERPCLSSLASLNKRFQSTLPRGERLWHLSTQRTIISFNPRSHVGSDRQGAHSRQERTGFNPRSHVGSDILVSKAADSLTVSIHAPTWGATTGTGRRKGTQQFQSTLPRGERPDYRFCKRDKLTVSIHAPTWGATISNNNVTPKSRFQSTLPRGERPILPLSYTPKKAFVSIHAPTWGATKYLLTLNIMEKVSIHAPTWGATPNYEVTPIEPEFQSTLPRGERLKNVQL